MSIPIENVPDVVLEFIDKIYHIETSCSNLTPYFETKRNNVLQISNNAKNNYNEICEKQINSFLNNILQVTTSFNNEKMRIALLSLPNKHLEYLVKIIHERLFTLLIILNSIPQSIQNYHQYTFFKRVLSDLMIIVGTVIDDIEGNIYTRN